jgi:PAS domain S-box-containing protein
MMAPSHMRARLPLEDLTAELRMSRERYHALAESIDEGLCVLERVEDAGHGPPDFRYVEANRAFAVQSGHRDVVGRTIRQMFPGEAEERLLPYNAVLDTGEPIRFERELISQGRVLELHAFRVDQPQHRVAVTVKDITARSAHIESELRYRRLFESAKDGILILDFANGRIVDANPFMSELLGYTSDEFAGRELWEIGLFADRQASEAAIRTIQEEGYLRFDNLPLESRDGREVEVEIVGNAYQEDRHRVIQCNIRDTSERSRLERKTNEQAQALSDLDQRKDEFLAMLSHELRTPLAPIASAVQVLRLHDVEGTIEHQAHLIIERQVGQLKHLIDDLLEVSRITNGKVHLREAPVLVSEVVARAVEAVGPLIEWRRHQLTVLQPATPIWLHGDAGRLQQVVANLLTNAAKYTSEGGQVVLSVQREDGDMLLRVSDTGMGIAPELLPRIFDLFSQAERSLDRSEGGLGIGLCLVHRLVTLHRGTVKAHSVLGHGSEFVVRLPIGPGPGPASPPPEVVMSQNAEPCRRVLVVDDSIDTAESLAMLLTASGHEVRVMHDGLSALAETRRNQPDVVIMDIGLPGIDGYEVAKRMRQQPAMGGVVLVAMTGYGRDSDRLLSLAAGFDHHLVKPADLDGLLQLVAQQPRRGVS